MTDIHGWIEYGSDYAGEVRWYGIVKAEHLMVPGNYDLFGCLFGVRNSAGFMPIVGVRGFPEDASEESRQELAAWYVDAHSHSWVTWAELASADWEEKIIDCDTGEPVKRRDIINSAWNLVFTLMATLAESYGNDKVRLVVWFDN